MRPAASRLAPAALLLALAAGCENRSRPLGLAAEERVALSAQLLAPASNELAIAGRPLLVRVRGSERGGQLRGVGFTAIRAAGEPVTLDSQLLTFAPTADTAISFQLQVPAGLANNTQIDLVGFALGPGAARAQAAQVSVIAVQCPANAQWC